MESKKISKICVIKAGSAVLTTSTGELDLTILQSLCKAITSAQKAGWHPILITSGAVAAGRGIFSNSDFDQAALQEISSDLKKRMFAAMGQTVLLSQYKTLLEGVSSRLRGAQVLLTKEAFTDTARHQSLSNTLREMISFKVLPIINTNDVLQVDSVDFADNDQLAAYIAASVGADYLILLTDTDGVFDKNPKLHLDAKRIPELSSENALWDEILIDDHGASKGGMGSKLKAMRLMADFGIPCTIASGKKPEDIPSILEGNESRIGTTLKVNLKKDLRPTLNWMATSASPQGTLIMSAFGADVIQRPDTREMKRGSVLAIGIEAVLGDFSENSIVSVRDESGRFLGVGRTRFSSHTLRHDLYKAEEKVVIHRDHFVPFTQGVGFTSERESLKLYISRFLKIYKFSVNEEAPRVAMWNVDEREGFKLEITGLQAEGILSRSTRIISELRLDEKDWIMYELASYYLQSKTNRETTLDMRSDKFLVHTSEQMSFSVSIENDELSIKFSRPECRTIKFSTQKAGVSGVLPSNDGSTLFVVFSDGSTAFFETASGRILAIEEIQENGIQFPT